MTARLPPPGTARGLGRRLLVVLGTIPPLAFLWFLLRGPGSAFDIVLVHTVAISLLNWAAIDLGRHVFRQPLRAVPPTYWPPPGRALLLLGLGVPGAWLAGNAIGNLYAGAPALPRLETPGLAWLLGFSLLLSLGFTAFFHQRGRQETLARQARDAHLAALQAQLEPHMLFNTLANLRALIEIDPPRAILMLDRLNAFLRATLGGSLAARHSLGEEAARIEDYLALMAVRLGPRLAVEVDIPDELRDVPVPALILQPLVENAIRHGIEPQPGGGAIRLRAAREARTLVLTLRDTGHGLPAGGATRPGGFGLAQLRDRLAALHGGHASLSIAPAGDSDGGTLATLRLPLADPPR